MSSRTELVDLVVIAGPAPEGVDQITHIIASVPAGPLTHAAKNAAPSYDQLIHDSENGGNLIKHMHENPVPEIALAHDIALRQQELSRSRRRLATAACVLTFFAGASALTNKGFDEFSKQDPQFQATTAHRLQEDVSAGAISGLAGGFIATFAGLALSGRLARRPAQNIVRKAAATSPK
jgi:hypothetical protein